MSHAQWTRGLRAKVDASWNLHRSLPHNMDFFILLSSLAGIYGSSGQGNYSAGCTFQDALARSRTAAGYRGSVSIDLGWMRTIGVIAENEEYRRNRRGLSDMGQVEEADLLAVLNHYCDPSGPSHDADRSQVMVGVVTPAHFRARGEGVPSMMERSLFAGFNASGSMQGDTVNTGGPKEGGAGRLLQQMSTTAERGAVVEEALKGKLARSLDVAAEDIDTRQTLAAYSADSLVAVELRSWIRKEFGVSVAVYELIGGADIKAVSWLIAERSEESKEAARDAE
ncbi:putative polyketide synthase protein [Rosellinia necatrix]|uniref:Putative polyketide synthase protein n=1 Tax=Rosellinia necatrix TaxID=77044 RepID=A0A1S8AB47_ROSNE|nr:putative polyketide synthase protein [Rosellinia necatrix]